MYKNRSIIHSQWFYALTFLLALSIQKMFMNNVLVAISYNMNLLAKEVNGLPVAAMKPLFIRQRV